MKRHRKLAAAKLHGLCATVAYLALAIASTADARTWRIFVDGSGDKPTIQAGIDVAAAGDTVLVGPGTYRTYLQFRGRDIVLKSEMGPAATIIDATGTDSSVVKITSGETRACVLEGFTFTGGQGTRRLGYRVGGGIYVLHSAPSIIGNFITNNVADNRLATAGAGGGIFVQGHVPSGPLLRPRIENNHISNNFGGFNAGGLGADGLVAPEIIGNTIMNNRVRSGDGGGIWILTRAHDTVIRGNVITDNEVGDHGGGIMFATDLFMINHRVEIIGNLVARNVAHGFARTGDSAGGMWLVQTLGVIRGNTVVGNRGEGGAGYGGGISLYQGGSPIVENNIIALSTAGGGIRCHDNATPVIRNNLAWGNVDSDGAADCQQWFTVNGNIQADPLFCGASTGNYSVASNSPALTHPAGPIGAFQTAGCVVGVLVQETTWSSIKLRFVTPMTRRN